MASLELVEKKSPSVWAGVLGPRSVLNLESPLNVVMQRVGVGHQTDTT